VARSARLTVVDDLTPDPETYTRSTTIEVAELVPFSGNLPYCHGKLNDGARCSFRAKFKMNGRPMCGVHLRPGAMFFPERLIKE
jgi:hypothetical protein